MLSVRRGTVKSRTSRALERLRGTLEEARMTELELRLHAAPRGDRLARDAAVEPDLRPAPAGRRSRRAPARRRARRPPRSSSRACSRFSSGARSAFLEIFRIRGATVERVERLPEVPTTGIPTRASGSAARRPSGASASGSSTSASPTASTSAAATASLVYGPARRPAARADAGHAAALWDGFVKKVAATGTRVEQVTVERRAGRSSSRVAEHFVMFIGQQRRDRRRADLPRRHGAPLEPRPAAAPAGGRSDARRGGRAGGVGAVGNLERRERCTTPSPSPGGLREEARRPRPPRSPRALRSPASPRPAAWPPSGSARRPRRGSPPARRGSSRSASSSTASRRCRTRSRRSGSSGRTAS